MKSLCVVFAFVLSTNTFAQNKDSKDDYIYYIDMSLHGIAEYMMTDSLGRRLGLNENSEELYEIPNGVLLTGGTSSPIPDEPDEYVTDDIVLPSPMDGHYDLKIFGFEPGKYELNILMARGFRIGNSFAIQGVTAKGMTSDVAIYYDRDTTKALSAIKLVTASSIQQELGIMRDLEWLAEADSFHLLSEPLQQAEARLARGDSAAARTALAALQTRLDGLQARLHEDAYSILKADVEGLLATLPAEVIALPAALTVAAEDIRAHFNGSAFRIDGNSHDLDGAASPYGARHGVNTTSGAGYEALLDAVSPSQRGAISGNSEAEPEVVQADLEMSLEAFVHRVLKRNDVMVVDQRLSTNVGSETLPFVAYAPEGLVLSGHVEGVGILIVDGTLEMKGAATWRGLIVVRGREGGAPPRVDLGGNAEVTGGVVLYERGGEAAALTVAGASAVRYSRAALDVLEDRLGL